MESCPPSVQTTPTWVAPGVVVTRAVSECSHTENGSDCNLADGAPMPNKELHLSGEGKTARPKPALIGERVVPRLAENTGRPRCAICGKWFHRRQQLSQHALVHSGVRKYKCRFCDRAFKQPSHLHQHHRIHTGETPYKCRISGCNRAFPQMSNLNHHLRNHDNPEPPPENTCVFCNRAYASETVLQTHLEKFNTAGMLGKNTTSLMNAGREMHHVYAMSYTCSKRIVQTSVMCVKESHFRQV